MRCRHNLGRGAAVSLTLGLAACGGSGTSDTDTAIETPVTGRQPTVTDPRLAREFETAEYFASGGLAIINAAAGYAARTTGREGGAGTRIAIIDSGVDRHPDLEIADRFALVGTGFGDPAPHGTHVAGIAAARRNGSGMHGVAFNADIVSIKIAPRDFSNNNQLEDDGIIASAIVSASGVNQAFLRPDGTSLDSEPSAEADVLNMSFGTSDNRGQVFAAMVQAADRGKIMVAALGNEELNGPLFAPASYAGDRQLDGLAVAVGALDRAGNVDADFSNLCGNVRRFCLFAPGDSVVSTLPGNSFGAISGTSMAAPHVAGAAATLLSAFPSKSPAEIVQRMLTTADDLGQPGVDARFGHGRLNLGAALSPVGFSSIPLDGANPGFDPESDEPVLAVPGWVEDGELDAALETVLMLDSQDFPFQTDLSGRVATSRSASPLGGFVRDRETRHAGAQLHDGVTARFWQPAPGVEFEPFEPWQARLRADSDQPPEYAIAFDMGGAVGVRFASDVPAPATFDFDGLDFMGGWLDARQWQPALAGRQGHSVAMSFSPAESWHAEAAVARTDGAQEQAGQFSLRYEASPRLSLQAGTMLLEEADTSWGLGGSEIGGQHGLRSLNSSIAARWSLDHDVSLIAGLGYALAIDRHASEDGLIRELRTGVALSSMAGLSKRELFGNDQLALVVMQPFRPDGTRAELELPVAQNADGSIQRRRTRVDLDPQGRQLDWLLTYSRDLPERQMRWSILGFAQLEPDHDADADPVFGAGARIHWAF